MPALRAVRSVRRCFRCDSFDHLLSSCPHRNQVTGTAARVGECVAVGSGASVNNDREATTDVQAGQSRFTQKGIGST